MDSGKFYEYVGMPVSELNFIKAELSGWGKELRTRKTENTSDPLQIFFFFFWLIKKGFVKSCRSDKTQKDRSREVTASLET